MFNREVIQDVVNFIQSQDGVITKKELSERVKNKYNLTRDRSVFYGEWFAIRFCKVKSTFSNTVLALSVLQKYDKIPFIVCAIKHDKNHLMLANATFLKKISHSSQDLRRDNIKGSFNGSDIMRNFEGVQNTPINFEFLFTSHENYSFEENLERLVEATNNIAPKGKRFEPTQRQRMCIYESIERAITFLQSKEYILLDEDLHNRVCSVESEILIASLIDNVNVRGRVIEYLITSREDTLKNTLMRCLHEGTHLPEISTPDKLGDYERNFKNYITQTDIKTKVLFLNSNPKGYNIDKLLSFLAEERSVYLIYIVAIDENENIKTKLCSMYNDQLLSGTKIIKHWAGRNSRGVTQYIGKNLESIINRFDWGIDSIKSQKFISECLEL